MSTLLIVLGFAVLAAIVVWLLLRGADKTLEAMRETPPPMVPDPPVVEAPAPKPQPVPAVQIRLLSERGRLLGTTKIAAKARKVQMTFTTKGIRGVFQATRQENGIWIYQRVQIDK